MPFKGPFQPKPFYDSMILQALLLVCTSTTVLLSFLPVFFSVMSARVIALFLIKALALLHMHMTGQYIHGIFSVNLHSIGASTDFSHSFRKTLESPHSSRVQPAGHRLESTGWG